MVVPGSGMVKEQAEEEGLDQVSKGYPMWISIQLVWVATVDLPCGCVDGRLSGFTQPASDSRTAVQRSVRLEVAVQFAVRSWHAYLSQVLLEAGFDWRQPGCSMCLAMNADKLGFQVSCASYSISAQ